MAYHVTSVPTDNITLRVRCNDLHGVCSMCIGQGIGIERVCIGPYSLAPIRHWRDTLACMLLAFSAWHAQRAFSITNAIASALVCSGMMLATRMRMPGSLCVYDYTQADER